MSFTRWLAIFADDVLSLFAAVAGREVHAAGVVIAVVGFVRHRERAGTQVVLIGLGGDDRSIQMGVAFDVDVKPTRAGVDARDFVGGLGVGFDFLIAVVT